MADISLSEWDRRMFRIMSQRKEGGLGEILEALEDTPAELPENFHLIITRHANFHYGDDDDSISVAFPSAFENAVKTKEADRSIFVLLEDSQRIHFYRDNLDYFDRHMFLVACVLEDQTLIKEKDFLSYVLNEIVHEVEGSLIEFRSDIEAGNFEIAALDMHLFDWCAKRIEHLAGSQNNENN